MIKGNYRKTPILCAILKALLIDCGDEELKRRLFLLLTCCITLFLVGCVYKNTKPEWLRGGIQGYEAYRDRISGLLLEQQDFAFSPSEQAIVFQQAKKIELQNGKTLMLLVFSIKPATDELALVPYFLACEYEGKLSYAFLDTGTNIEFTCADITGDAQDEAVIYINTGETGGSGSHANLIYGWREDNLTELYRGQEYECTQITGFSAVRAEGFQYTVQNPAAGFSATFTDPEEYPFIGLYYNDDGSLTERAKMENPFSNAEPVQNFLLFRPADVEGDGIFEIMACEPFSAYPQHGYIGFAYAALRYDENSGTLIPVRAGFLPSAQTRELSGTEARKLRKEYEQGVFPES